MNAFHRALEEEMRKAEAALLASPYWCGFCGETTTWGEKLHGLHVCPPSTKEMKGLGFLNGE